MDNVFDYTKTYYKITNKEENHNGFQFKDGLNEDVIPFNKILCHAGGIYFSDIENIFRFFQYNDTKGYYVREVTVPEDAEVLIEGNKYKASKIILGERKELNLDTLKELITKGANIRTTGESALWWASGNGHLEVVKYLVEQGVDIHVEYDLALELAYVNRDMSIIEYIQSLK